MSQLEWTSGKVLLNNLTPYSKNPRKISKEAYAKLKKSLQDNGYHQRLLANIDGTIVGGHQRLRALKELGIKEVEVLTPNRELTPEEFDRINIQDNLPFGEFDMDLLSEHFDADKLIEWGMPEEWLPKQDGVVNEPEGDEDDAGAVPDVPKTLRGDVWELKRQKNTIHPTMKPVELIEMALSDQDGKKLVYDGFGGSGSTMVAAHKLGRTAYLMELDEKYCDVIVNRMSKLFPTLPVKRNGEPYGQA